jgi:threonylcarbamoyladenosine tRNA methylthiotransferase MtaB
MESTMPIQENGYTRTFAIETHGCKLNQADTLVIAREFKEAGLVQVAEDEQADVYVVNSCTVTHVADRKARQALRAARRRNPNATIVATGCYAQRTPDALEAIAEIDLVFGNVQKPRLVRQVLDWRGEQAVACATGDEAEYFSPHVDRSRAMVKIQEGCNQVCAYCIVPKVRGRERSIPTDELVSEVSAHVANGYKEVVLTGTQLGSYGFDLARSSLASLIRAIIAQTDIQRLRVSSLQPKELADELLALWDDQRLCPHFHMPLQSGSDSILRKMRRRYNSREYEETVERIRRRIPVASITADVIVGFPGESDRDFLHTYELCERIGFADMHVFPYSVRPGTSAAHYEGHISPDVKGERMQALLELAKRQARQFKLSRIGATRRALWESQGMRDNSICWFGLTDDYIRVSTKSTRPLLNEVTQATLTALAYDGIVEADLN